MTSAQARESILARLGARRPAAPPPVDPANAWAAPLPGHDEAVELLRARLAAVKTEVHLTDEAAWPDELARLLAERNPDGVAFGPASPIAPQILDVLARPGMPKAMPYARPVEELRDALFQAGASVTTASGGVAENGSLMLAPDTAEPRLLSLVPPLHIVVLRSRDVFVTFGDALAAAASRGGGLPPNLVFVSGPSKTADIELTLTFGVHGPKDLVVLLVKDATP